MKKEILVIIFMFCAAVSLAQNHKANYCNIDRLIEEIAEDEEYAQYSFISRQMISSMGGMDDCSPAMTIDYIKSVHIPDNLNAGASSKTMKKIKDVCDNKLKKWNFEILMDNREPAKGYRHLICCYYGEGGLNYLVSIECNFIANRFNIAAFVGAGKVQDMIYMIVNR